MTQMITPTHFEAPKPACPPPAEPFSDPTRIWGDKACASSAHAATRSNGAALPWETAFWSGE